MTPLIERDASDATKVVYTKNPLSLGGIGGLISSIQPVLPAAGHIPEVALNRSKGKVLNVIFDALYYHDSNLGNVNQITDSSGAVIQTYDYDAFGNIVNQTGSFTQAYAYKTKEYSPETGLVFFGARYYNPLIGRFITKDPLGMADGPNVYLYCLGDPINRIDPLGTDIWIGMGTGPLSQFHENISVGSPIGSSVSYTYGTTYTITSQYGLTGKVMDDSQQTVPESFTDYYLTTTPEQDKEARDILDQMKKGDIKGPYRFTNPSCRNFSRDMFDYFKKLFTKNEKSTKTGGSCK